MTIAKKNLANNLGIGVVSLAPIPALPWYLSSLGLKQFGLISFVVMLQTVLGLLDAGMRQALAREFAVRLDVADGQQHAAALFERVCSVLAWNQGPCRSAVSVKNANFFDERWLAARLYD